MQVMWDNGRPRITQKPGRLDPFDTSHRNTLSAHDFHNLPSSPPRPTGIPLTQ